MKIVYITNGINGSGGLERVLSVKASHLAEALGYDVHIVRLNEGNETPFYAFSPRIKFHSIWAMGSQARYLQSYIKGIQRVIKQINPSIISVCDDGLKAFFIPILLGKQRPILYERHASINLNFSKKKTGFTSKFKNQISYWLMRKLAVNFDAFVVLTQGNLKEWQPGNLHVIGNPLSFYPKESALLNEKKVIAVGSHNYNKGFDLLLEAWVILSQKFPEWELTIYGKTDKLNTYYNYAKKLHICETVSFFNPVTNIQDKYLKSSILVLPSRSEGFGMVLIEAMACGVPCVSFACPHGPADIISNNIDGLLVKNGDIVALAAALAKLMADDSLRIEMGARAKANVKQYLPKQVMNAWVNLFTKIKR